MPFNLGGNSGGGFFGPDEFDFSIGDEFNTSELLRQIREEEAQREIEALQKSTKRDARTRAIGNIGAALPLIAAIIGADRGSDFQRAASNLSDLMFNIDQSRKQFQEKERSRQHQLQVLQKELEGRKEIQGAEFEFRDTEAEEQRDFTLQRDETQFNRELQRDATNFARGLIEKGIDQSFAERMQNDRQEFERVQREAGLNLQRSQFDEQWKRQIAINMSDVSGINLVEASAIVDNMDSPENLSEDQVKALNYYNAQSKADNDIEQKKNLIGYLAALSNIPVHDGYEIDPITQSRKPIMRQRTVEEIMGQFENPEAIMQFIMAPSESSPKTNTGETMDEINVRRNKDEIMRDLKQREDIIGKVQNLTSEEDSEEFAQLILQEVGDPEIAMAVIVGLPFKYQALKQAAMGVVKPLYDEKRKGKLTKLLTDFNAGTSDINEMMMGAGLPWQ